MDLLEGIATRRSIRHYLDIPVDQETILTIVEAGTCAPSAGNLQDWRFVVVDDRDLMKSISDYCLGQSSVHNAAFLIVICADPERTTRMYGLRGERLYAVQDCAAASQNMLLAAHALGLGGCWVGAFDEDKLRSLLGIPPSVRPQVILSFGYPAEAPTSKVMADLALITFFNSYGSRIKNVHRVLKDYHVDWEKRINQAHGAYRRVVENLAEKSQLAGQKAKEAKSKGALWLKKYKDQASENLKLRKK